MQTHKYISNLLIQSVPHLCGWTRESSGFMHCWCNVTKRIFILYGDFPSICSTSIVLQCGICNMASTVFVTIFKYDTTIGLMFSAPPILIL